MLKDINQSIRKKLKNKTKKMMFLAVLFFSFVIIAVNSYNRIEKINMEKGAVPDIDNKVNLCYYSS